MKLGAILPLRIRGSYGADDLGRADNLFRTLQAFVEPGLLDPFVVVTPAGDAKKLVKARLTRWENLGPIVIPEEELVPELTRHRNLRGWRKQQIVKLAATRFIDRDFYITFDADIICLKELRWQDLIIDNRAILQYEPRFYHPRWWKSSAALLGVNPEIGEPGVGMTVTPAILSTALCKKLADELANTAGRHWVDSLCLLHKHWHPWTWTLRKFRSRKWTEYSLYYLFAVNSGLLEEYHVICGTESVRHILFTPCNDPTLEDWDVAASFSAKDPGLFYTVSSRSGPDADAIWALIEPFVPGTKPELKNKR